MSLAELEAAFQQTEGPDMAMLQREAEQARAREETQAPPALDAAPAAAALGEERGDIAELGRESALAAQTIRVNVDVVENLMTMVSELVLTRNQLLQMVRHKNNSEFKVPLQRLSNITAELQDGVMKTRMQPIGNAWKKLPRIVRDVAHDLNKKIKLVMEGQDTELDRQVLELIKDPLTHMVRNSCDHGVEKPETRVMAGKPETGSLTLRAFHEGGHIIIEIADDGAGLNTEKIRRKAVEKGLVGADEAAGMSDNQIHRFVFSAGFSTAAKVTNLSGRGVGMDVVRTNIEQIGGTVDLNSVEGRGTTFTIKIPLTLAIISALVVGAAGQRFAIPQLSVLELVRVGARSQNQVEIINATPVMRLRERLLPLVNLTEVLDMPASQEERRASFVVVMQVGGQRFGVVVDEVFDTEEIVVKPLASALRGSTALFSGNTILGDGSVIMIVDPNGVVQNVRRHQDELERDEAAAQSRATAAEETTSMLIFRAGGDEPKAAPLSLVTRLEEIPVENLEQGGGRLLVQYRGKLMPLAHISDYGEVKSEGAQPVLVFTDNDRSAGLVVDEIVDVVDERVNIELTADTPGVAGTAVLRGKATQVIDVGHYLTRAEPDWFSRTPETVARPPRRVLLVDDNAFFRNVMKPLLNAAGYEVIAVESAAEAWTLNDAGEDFDIIVSDLEMPGQDGVAFAERLQTDDRWAHIPRVALSGLSQNELPERARLAFAHCIPKNDRASLVAALDYALAAEGEAA